jgi:hypothetical protein
MKGARLYRGALFVFVKFGKSDVDFSNRALLSSSVFPPFVVITAWVTLLYVVGLAECRAATSIGRIGLESLALGRVANDRDGSGSALSTLQL